MKVTKEAIYTETDSIASKLAGLTDAVADAPSEWPEQSKITLPLSKNRYGLDIDYFSKLIKRELSDLSNLRGDEFARICARMAKTANSGVLNEQEFKVECEPQEQEWENGVPPVGRCEYRAKNGKDSWLEFNVWLTKHGWVVGQCVDSGLRFAREPEPCWHEDYEFRPIQSTAERKREAFAKSLSDSMSDSGSLLTDFDTVYEFGLALHGYLSDNDMLKDGE